ncbi:ATP-binding protein [Minwuia sp.]|uniref:ATP-binding protein n=1 Tax=Minwuia sp. TaxID=2493630 RepID=UPI003A957A8E
MSSVDASGNRREPVLQNVDVSLRRDADGRSDSPSLDRDARVRAEMISEMIRESGQLRTSPFVFIAVLAMVYVDRAPIWPTVLLIVGTAIFVIVGMRLRRAFEAADPVPANAEAWGLRYTVLSGFVGLVWGPALAGYFDPGSYPYQAFLALLTVGSLFAVIMHRALYPPAFMALAFPAALPLIVMFALNGDRISLVTALLGALGLIGMMGWLRVLHRRFRESFALRFENIDLIERLEAAHRAAETARQSAEAGDRTKSEFLATISHELRTPMNGIIGMTGLMLGTKLTAQQTSYGEIIRESADALLNLINDILDLTKLESGRIDLDESPFELTQTIEGAAGLMAERAQAKGLSLTSHIGPDVPDIITADAGRLRQVLLNLLSNAIKFTEDGAVDLSVDLAPHARSVLRIQVRDSGIGIDPETLPRLFRPFSQAGGISRRYGGTGLGLAISRRLVDAMGGEISVESTPGEGTLFTVDMPIRSGKTVRHPESLEGLRVLLAGPEGRTRDAAARYARDWGAHVVEATSLGEMAGYLRDTDCVVIDWRVEGGAARLARELRAHPDHADQRLILTVPVGVIESVSEDEDALFDTRLLQPLRRNAFHRALSGKAAQDTVHGDGSIRRPKHSPDRSLRVLVVDDVAVNQKLAVSIVEMAGHEAVAAGSAREALQALRALPYDLVLMDVEMPEMDGLEATRTIRQMPGATGEIRIIAMTAHPGGTFIDRCLEAGMDGFLAKPLNAEELFRLLGAQSAHGSDTGMSVQAGAAHERKQDGE